jgi:hypothetical protein
VLSHPWSADLACNAIRVFRPGELEDQDQMCLIDLRDASRERTCIDNKPHTFLRCLHGCVCHRVTQAEVVDDDVHRADPSAAPRRPAQASLANTHMECGLSTAQGLVARGLRGAFGGESAPAVVDVYVATHMRGLMPHDRMCEMRSVAVLSRRALPMGAAPSVLWGRSSRRCAGALSSPRR